MLRKLTLLLSMLMAFGLTMSATAQDNTTLEGTFEGIESGYARTFMVDFDAMIEAAQTPGAELEFDEEGVMLIMTAVLTFDSDDNADASIDTFMEESDAGAAAAEQELQATDVDDLGDRAVLFGSEGDEESMMPASSMLLVQDGDMLFLLMLTGGEFEAGQQQIQDIATFMLDREIQTEEVTLNEDGTSTGGAFDLMPTAEDTDLVSGLSPAGDEDMMSDGSGL